MTVCLNWLAKKSDLLVFVGGAFIGAAFEYLCSWFQEMVFGTVSWEYSDMLFNLDGRINLLYSIFWGFLAVLWIKVLYPWLSRLVEKIPSRVGKPLTYVLLVFMILNSLMSAAATYRMDERYRGLEASNAVEVYLDEHYPDERMHQIYPNMRRPEQMESGGQVKP